MSTNLPTLILVMSMFFGATVVCPPAFAQARVQGRAEGRAQPRERAAARPLASAELVCSDRLDMAALLGLARTLASPDAIVELERATNCLVVVDDGPHIARLRILVGDLANRARVSGPPAQRPRHPVGRNPS